MPSTTVTRMGETWDEIAFRTLGSETFMDALIDANPEHRAVVRFPYGVEISVPDVETASASDSLPPWKRGA